VRFDSFDRQNVQVALSCKRELHVWFFPPAYRSSPFVAFRTSEEGEEGGRGGGGGEA
jgi:hypothetical protein